jgi:hypothetical protein
MDDFVHQVEEIRNSIAKIAQYVGDVKKKSHHHSFCPQPGRTNKRRARRPEQRNQENC